MSIRTAVSVFALTAATLAPIATPAASIFGRSDRPDATAPVKGKTIKLTLKNRTADAMTLLVNDAPVTLAANSETTVRAVVDSNIYAEDRTTVKLHVTNDLSGNTVSFR